MALKTTPKTKSERATHSFKTLKSNGMNNPNQGHTWWIAKDDKQRAEQLCATLVYLKTSQTSRLRQAAIFARLYGGQSLFSFIGANMSLMDQYSPLAPNRPTFNLVSAVTDTLVSKITQSRPTPVFLTDNGDYRERNLAKKLNSFILGEFYRTQAYEHGEYLLRDGLIQGTGAIKVYRDQDDKVALERVLITELFVDLQEAAFGKPRRLYQIKLYDREVLKSMFPKKVDIINEAVQSTVDKSAQSSQTVSDLVQVVEGWALPSGEGAGDGYHSIAVSSGELDGEGWKKKTFPFVFFHHKKRQLGFWSCGVAECLMGTQYELNSLLDTISKAIKLVGVPRVFYEEGSKVNKAAFSNKIGVLIPYRGTKPTVEVSNCVPAEMYTERDRMIQYGFQQEGLSMMAATSEKPEGLDSGEAQRVYHDINSERFAALEKRYANFYVDLAYQVIDLAKDIAEEMGHYETVFVDRKKGSKTIDLPSLSLLNDPFVIQVYTESSLPKDPAGRLSKVTEMIQSGMIDIQEGRRLLDFPDLGQVEILANAAEERIYMQLDQIIEDSKYEPPDQFMPIAPMAPGQSSKAEQIVVQYINLYATCKLEGRKMDMLRDWFTQIQVLKQQMAPPAPPMPGAPQAVPQPLPQSNLMPRAAA